MPFPGADLQHRIFLLYIRQTDNPLYQFPLRQKILGIRYLFDIVIVCLSPALLHSAPPFYPVHRGSPVGKSDFPDKRTVKKQDRLRKQNLPALRSIPTLCGEYRISGILLSENDLQNKSRTF